MDVASRLPNRVVALLTAMVIVVAPMIAAPTNAITLPLAGIAIAVDPGHNGGNATHVA